MNESSRRSISMGFTREQFPEGTHMCLVYNDERERRKIMHKYVESGLLEKENVFYFADTAKPEEVVDWLMGLGLDITEDSDKLFDIKQSVSAYCPTGEFCPESMYARLREMYMDCRKANHPGVRVTGEMSWALLGLPGTERLMEYESYVNILFSEYPVTAICQYDATRFDGRTILDVLKVHPSMVVNGQIVRNPYYMRHDEFMAELQSRTLGETGNSQ
jgi:hypothetical protein